MIKLRNWARSIRRIRKTVQGRDVLYRPQIHCERMYLGNDGARWCIFPTSLSPASVVYSFGVGDDISFDRDLIRLFKVCVYAFDPTPRSVKWLRAQGIPAQFLLHEYGIADYDGVAHLAPPENPEHVSYSMVHGVADSRAKIEVPVYRLATIMKMLGHTRLDLLKMDIEGTEYEVLKDLISSSLEVEQLLIEFHHRWPEVGIARTKQAVKLLNQAGFKIFDVSSSGEEYSFRRVE